MSSFLNAFLLPTCAWYQFSHLGIQSLSYLHLFSVGVLFVLCVASPRAYLSLDSSFCGCGFVYALCRSKNSNSNEYKLKRQRRQTHGVARLLMLDRSIDLRHSSFTILMGRSLMNHWLYTHVWGLTVLIKALVLELQGLPVQRFRSMDPTTVSFRCLRG